MVGVGLVTSEDVDVAPAVSPIATPASPGTASPIATPKLTIAVRPTRSPSGFAGLVHLPPEDAEPSTPQVGELVDMYFVAGGGPPYRGTARLYADGRLIWNRYHGSQNGQTTGYLEQRLTPEGVELAKAEKYLARKDPLELLEWLPLHAWEARTPVPFVPSGYGICLYAENPGPGRAVEDTAVEPAELITMLPGSVSRLLAGREFVSPIDWDAECVAQTMEETRVLERVLRDGGFDQEAFLNRFMVQYFVAVPGAYGMRISLMFEPRFPDGSVGCSACG